VTLAREFILVTAGGMHALWLAFRRIAARRPGGTVLCLGMAFVGVANLIRMSGLDIRFVASDLADLTLEDIDRHLSDDISCLYVNSPHNPSGEYLGREQMRQLGELCERRGLDCVVDAVYDSCFFDGGGPTLPIGLGQSDRCYFICSMSKNFGLPGARIGWLISSAPNIRTTLSWLESENVSISSVSQALAVRILVSGNHPLAASMKIVRGIVLDFLTREFNIRRLPPAGTQMALELPFSDVEHFADDALNRHELVLATSGNYAGCRGGFIRLPFSYLPENTERALQRLELAMHTYRERRTRRA
jgi:beta-methylarginine biosynthesis bifunctional aminotransferase